MTVVVRQAMADDSGLFTDGTAITKSFVDQLYDQIDDQDHSTTNPTIKPKATTDEVVNARGSKTTLDARLDVSLNEDGTLKSQASLVTGTQFQSALGSRNVVLNGDLDTWTAGGAAAPDNFTLTGAGATIARTGPAMVDTFTFGTGLGGFAAKITRAGNDWKLQQDVIAAGVFANFANVKGQKFSVAVKGKTGLANALRIVVDDGVTTTASSYHTGGGTEEHLSVTATIGNSATKLSCYVEGDTSNGDCYVGGFVFVFADVAPSDWQPLSGTNDASATVRGLVSTGAQTFAGLKTLNGGVGFASGSSLLNFAYAKQTADLTKNNSTTLADATGLNFAVGANEVWAFQFILKGISTAVADWKLTLTGPAAPTAVWFGLMVSTDIPSAAAVTAFGSVVSAGGAGAEETFIVQGLLRNGANAGTVQLQMAQNTLEATNTVLRTESFVLAHRVQ